MNSEHFEFDDWVKQGQENPMNNSLKHHMKHCTQCQTNLDDLNQVHKYFSISTPILTDEKIAGIKFRLKTECNINNNKPRKKSIITLFREWFYPLAGVGIAILIIVFGLFWFLSTPPSKPSIKPSKVAIFPDSGAKWRYVSKGKTEVVSVESGSVRFSVNSLSPGESFHVISGDDWVEVRGTMFKISVFDHKLHEVSVSKGVVAVHAQGINRLLLAGHNWKRTPLKKISAPSLVANIISKKPKINSEPPGSKLLNTNKIKTAPKRQNKNKQIILKTEPEDKNVVRKPITKPLIIPKTTTPDPHLITVNREKNLITKKFVTAYKAIQSGDWRRAVKLFQALLRERGLGSKRQNVMFWLSQAHLRGGQYSMAKKRLKQFLREYPGSWRSKDVKRQLNQLKTHK